MCHARISKEKIRLHIRYFCADLTTSKATSLSGVNRKTALRLLQFFGWHKVELVYEECPPAAEVESDEIYFRPNRAPGKPGRGASKKTPVFGILERQGRVHIQIIEYRYRSTFHDIVLGRMGTSAIVISDGFVNFDRLVSVGFERRYSVNHIEGEFAQGRS